MTTVRRGGENPDTYQFPETEQPTMPPSMISDEEPILSCDNPIVSSFV
jgi:hypothetical protein